MGCRHPHAGPRAARGEGDPVATRRPRRVLGVAVLDDDPAGIAREIVQAQAGAPLTEGAVDDARAVGRPGGPSLRAAIALRESPLAAVRTPEPESRQRAAASREDQR